MATDNDRQAREMVKHISDAALELAFVRHDLKPDTFNDDDYETSKERVAAWEEEIERIKNDVLGCLTGEETGCLDPEELDESNCELLWTQAQLKATADEARLEGQTEGLLRARQKVAESIDGHIAHWRRIGDEAIQLWKLDALRTELTSDIHQLSPDPHYGEKLKEEAWQPIETAPKDGTAVLILFTDGAIAKARWEAIDWDEWLQKTVYDWTCISCVFSEHDKLPTHWMAIPLGAKGGRSVSEKKLKAIKGNLAKAQAAKRKKVEDQP